MARPSVQHNGFLIPNAQDVSNSLLAEPDRIDFNTVADARWGIISGCAIGEQGALTVSIGSGVALVNGVMVPVAGDQHVTMTQPTGGARFVLIVVDMGGRVQKIGEEIAPSGTPVYPDVPLDNTLVAAVYVSSASASLHDFVVDKRQFLTPALFTHVGPTRDLVSNFNSLNPPSGEPGVWFRISGQGEMTWAGEIKLRRKDQYALLLDQRLEANELLAQNHITSTSGNVQSETGLVLGRNLRNSPKPIDALGPPNPQLGDLWQDTTNGTVYVGTRDIATGVLEWSPLATGDSALPVGTIIDSVETVDAMRDKGWVALNGQVISETEFPRLFNLEAMAIHISNPEAPREMTLPNLSRRFRLTDFDASDVAREGGANLKTITPSQMPSHHHNVRVDAHGTINPTAQLSGMSGGHAHPILGDGKHDHKAYDKGHTHPRNFVISDNTGTSMLDGLINDGSHTSRVSGISTTEAGYANIVLDPADDRWPVDPAQYGTAQPHRAGLPITGLTHTVSQDERGDSAPFDVTPAYFTVRSYIKLMTGIWRLPLRTGCPSAYRHECDDVGRAVRRSSRRADVPAHTVLSEMHRSGGFRFRNV